MVSLFVICFKADIFHLFISLLLYGVVCTLSERNEAAETFFEAATCVDPKSILAWTMLGICDIWAKTFKNSFRILLNSEKIKQKFLNPLPQQTLSHFVLGTSISEGEVLCCRFVL